MVEMVQCSRGHRFPVNLKKHRNRTYVMCPHPGCHEKVKIRRRRLPFSKLWPGQKEWQKQRRREMKERGRKHKSQPAIALPSLGRMTGILALSRLIQKKEEERLKLEKSTEEA